MDHDFGRHCASKLNRKENEVYKTLLIHCEKQYITAVIPVNCVLNLKNCAKLVGLKKVEMADPQVAEKLTGYVVGGISPLGQKKYIPTIIDLESTLHDEILVSGGKRGLSIGLSPKDLVTLLNASIGKITDLRS